MGGSCSTSNGFPSRLSTVNGSLTMWFLFEMIFFPKHCMFKTWFGWCIPGSVYILNSFVSLASRTVLLYNTGEQVLGGYVLGSVIGTFVFVFVSRTTMGAMRLKEGLYPLWIKLGLKNNLSEYHLGLGTFDDHMKLEGLRRKQVPLRQAKENIRLQYELLQQATAPLIQQNKQMMRNKAK